MAGHVPVMTKEQVARMSEATCGVFGHKRKRYLSYERNTNIAAQKSIAI
jgi:hypothetical protein